MGKSDSRRRPDFEHERLALAEGVRSVAGVDEAGRGPLAGPVVAAAVILDPDHAPIGLDDSKRLSAARRAELFTEILELGEVAIVAAPPDLIDRLNIRGATLWAMREAVRALATKPGLVLIDGRDIPHNLGFPARTLIGGDGISASIAAASIIAKVTRDLMCPIFDSDHPGFQFARHKGYGTELHMEALVRLGPTQHHRQSFAPVREAAATPR